MSSTFHAFGGSKSSGGSPVCNEAERLDGRSEPDKGRLLNLRLVRGPLQPGENESILSQYNALTSSNISNRDFLRWIQNSPDGPAWHAILETKEGDIVGHTSLIPLRGIFDGRAYVAAKSEYSFIREEFRASKIRGFEHTGRLKNLIYIDELFRRCREEGWNPLLISTPSGFHRVFRSIKCYPVEFPLWECLLILRPQAASRNTPNLRGWQRVSLWGAGLLQSALWARVLFSSDRGTPRAPRIDALPWPCPEKSLSFFQDRDSLAWRYPEEQYERMAAADGEDGELIVKYGAANRYLRVCQWSPNSGHPTRALIARLIRKAWQQRALGVRWSVYGEDAKSVALVGRLRQFGFLCVRRVRTLLINTASGEFLSAGAWNLTDSMFSFDL